MPAISPHRYPDKTGSHAHLPYTVFPCGTIPAVHPAERNPGRWVPPTFLLLRASALLPGAVLQGWQAPKRQGDLRPPSLALNVGWETSSSFMASATFRCFISRAFLNCLGIVLPPFLVKISLPYGTSLMGSIIFPQSHNGKHNFSRKIKTGKSGYP